MPLPHVYILTWCTRIELLYGATLVFKSLRTGFPSAPLHVADAASLPAARAEIRRCANNCQATFMQLEQRLQIEDFIEHVLVHQDSGSAVFVDPDVCFWESIENWQFDALAAGRHIPRYHCEFTNSISEPRLHTSLLWIPDVARMRREITTARGVRRHWEPFRCIMVPIDDRWHFFDTAAGLYSLFAAQMQAFDERQLDAYDHLFSGSFSDSVQARLGPDYAPQYRDIHAAAQHDYRTLKGCWRVQEQYFQSRLA